MPHLPKVVTEPSEILQIVRAAQREGKRVGLVPTMGALHQGHLSLVESACESCDITIVTIFVNPTQFAPGEDFEKYTRKLVSGLANVDDVGADIVFAPNTDEIYRQGHSTYVEPPAVSLPLEGKCRPGHFQGVATIVLKLFLMIPADVAFFGRKDYQQTLVIRRMVADLNVPMEIVVCPTVREPDGLAMSSRNAYLSSEERQRSLAIANSLQKAQQLYADGEKSASSVLTEMRRILEKAGIDRIDYVALVDPETLVDREDLTEPTVALIAAYVGATRLIDNQPL